MTCFASGLQNNVLSETHVRPSLTRAKSYKGRTGWHWGNVTTGGASRIISMYEGPLVDFTPNNADAEIGLTHKTVGLNQL